MMAELIPCTTMFSNGSEYEWFIENQCEKCTKFRKGYCRTYRMTEKARWDEKYFPYDDLQDIKGYAGKHCKRFTTEKQKRQPRQCKGQLELYDTVVLTEVKR